MPRTTHVGECLRCRKMMPDEVKHKRHGYCTACSSWLRREQIRAEMGAANAKSSIAGDSALAVLADAGRSARGLAELLLLGDGRDGFVLVQEGEAETLHHRDVRGIWVALTGLKSQVRQEAAALYATIEERREAQAEVMKGTPNVWLADSSRVVIQSIESLYMLARKRGVHVVQHSDLNKQPPGVFPLLDGVLDASTTDFEVLESADESWEMTDAVVLRITKEDALEMLKVGYDGTNQDFPEQVRMDIDLIWARQQSLLGQVAYRMSGPDKGIDNFKDATSGAGKSMVADVCAAAAPGLVTKIEIEPGMLVEQKWTEINAAAATSLVVIVEEVGLAPISRKVLVELTGTAVPLSRKYEQFHMVPRRATVIAVGADWMFYPYGAQGVAERVAQVAETNSIEAWQRGDGIRERLLERKARLWLLWTLLMARCKNKPIIHEDALQVLQERAEFTPVERFVYAVLEHTGRMTDEVDLDNLTTHWALKWYGVPKELLRKQLEKAIEKVFGQEAALGPVNKRMDDKKLVSFTHYKVRWGG